MGVLLLHLQGAAGYRDVPQSALQGDCDVQATNRFPWNWLSWFEREGMVGSQETLRRCLPLLSNGAAYPRLS